MDMLCCRGLSDLRSGIISTPLAAKETFLDGEVADDVHSLWLQVSCMGKFDAFLVFPVYAPV